MPQSHWEKLQIKEKQECQARAWGRVYNGILGSIGEMIFSSSVPGRKGKTRRTTAGQTGYARIDFNNAWGET